MNVLELLSQELKDKNWTIEEKCYYIYLRSCQLFSYDPRFKFLQSVLCDRRFQDEIKNQIIDLENVQNNLVVCSSISQQVISPLLSELLDISSDIKGTGHIWNEFNDSKRKIRADATITSDINRTKMQLSTNGYNPEWVEPNFKERLKQISIKTGYISDEFTNILIAQQVEKMFEEYVNSESITSDDFLINRLYTMKENFESIDKLISFSDADFAISYLEQKFLKKDHISAGIVQLFENRSKEDWDFYNIYTYDMKDDTLYFILRKVEQEYCFYEITRKDAVQYTKSFRGMGRELIK